MLGLKFIDVGTLVRGSRGVFWGKSKIKFSFSVPFINFAVSFSVFIGMSPAWDPQIRRHTGWNVGPTAADGNFSSHFTGAVISVGEHTENIRAGWLCGLLKKQMIILEDYSLFVQHFLL